MGAFFYASEYRFSSMITLPKHRRLSIIIAAIIDSDESINRKERKHLMITSVNLKEVQYIDWWAESDERYRWQSALLFPEGSLNNLSVVHFTLEPGDALPIHTDSGEELIILLTGKLEATIGDEKAVVQAPSLTRIPSMVWHSFVNTGSEKATVIGVFPGSYSIATFREVLYPPDMQVLRVPPPAAADSTHDQVNGSPAVSLTP
jgi:quercetin dioxygenase-like cupin family protein